MAKILLYFSLNACDNDCTIGKRKEAGCQKIVNIKKTIAGIERKLLFIDAQKENLKKRLGAF